MNNFGTRFFFFIIIFDCMHSNNYMISSFSKEKSNITLFSRKAIRNNFPVNTINHLTWTRLQIIYLFCFFFCDIFPLAWISCYQFSLSEIFSFLSISWHLYDSKSTWCIHFIIPSTLFKIIKKYNSYNP